MDRRSLLLQYWYPAKCPRAVALPCPRCPSDAVLHLDGVHLQDTTWCAAGLHLWWGGGHPLRDADPLVHVHAHHRAAGGTLVPPPRRHVELDHTYTPAFSFAVWAGKGSYGFVTWTLLVTVVKPCMVDISLFIYIVLSCFFYLFFSFSKIFIVLF